MCDKVLAIDCETTGTHIHHGCRAFMLAACSSNADLFCWEAEVNPYTREVTWCEYDIAEICEVVNNHDTIVFHNGSFDLTAIEYISLDLYNIILSKRIDDTLIQSHIINSSGSHGLKDLSLYHLDVLDDDEAGLKKAVREAREIAKAKFPEWLIASSGLESLPNYRGDYAFCDYWLPKAIAVACSYPSNHPWRTICQVYNERDVERTIVLDTKFKKYLSTHNLFDNVYEDHRRVLPVVKSIQDHGFHFFYDKAVEVMEQLQFDIFPYQDKISRLVGKDFNINSPKQMQALLYDKYELPVIAYTGTKQPSCDAATLQELLSEYCDHEAYAEAKEFLTNVLAVRVRNTTANYISNYLSYAKEYVVEYTTGEKIRSYFLHPSLNQTGTSTTRFSCSQPNSQNISKGKEDIDEEGAKERVFNLRELFGPPPGYHWCTIDYKSLQLIIFAYESGDEGLIETFLSGGDPHNYVACGLFDTDSPTELERRIAKNINYGLIFGAGERKIDYTAGKEGTFRLYNQQFPNVSKYMNGIIKQARYSGYVSTAWGYPLTVSQDRAYKGVNYIVQGDEGEIVKRAMVYTHSYLQQYHSQCKLVMQIHDELVFEYPEWYEFPLQEICRLMMKPASDIGWVTPVDAAIVKDHWGAKEKC